MCVKRNGQNIGKKCLDTVTVNCFTNIKRTGLHKGKVEG